MSDRKKIVAGNWKMNKTFQEAEELITEIADMLDDVNTGETEVVVCPPALYLEMVMDVAYESNFTVGAQNVHPEEKGAYTGEISAAMLKELEVKYCIVGHSERRKYFLESNDFLRRKVDALLLHNMNPIFCCGEVLAERQENRHFEVVKQQLEESLFHLSAESFGNIVIAYEPVWAIGTGVNATGDQAQEMHAYIRSLISQKYGQAVADATTILYGGSCTAANARELFAQPDVDGGLIGGASLKADDFLQIATSF
jgi:triosephosphate isomerase